MHIMERFCDLHTHSTFSDGTDTPEALLKRAQERGLCAIALTDHNTVGGLTAFLKAAEHSSVRAIPGAEFSADYEGIELHILGLFLKPEQFDTVTAMTQEYHRLKDQSNIDLVRKLKESGYAIDYGKIKAATPEGQVNRALIAAELTRLGYTESVQDAFQKLLKPERGYYVPPRRPAPCETIRFIKSLGAVAVLAHPFLNLKEQQLRLFLSQAVSWGLDGMETMYSTYDAETEKLSREIAGQYGLLPSGGSDYHGKNKPHIELGIGQGNLAIPQGCLTALEERVQK